MKRLWYLAAVALLLAACGEKTEKEEPAKSPEVKNTPVPTKAPEVKTVTDGEHKETYPDGKTKIVGQMRNGQRHGQWIAYYPDGTKQSETYYEDGKKNGKSATFFPNGTTRYIGYYQWDEPSGTWDFYDEKGKLVTTKEYK